MKVLKFGGTSVGTVNSLRNVKEIVEGCDGQVIVVVSALGGITDRLISTANMAAEGNDEYLKSFDEIVTRHNDVIEGIVPEDRRVEVRDVADSLLEELSNIYHGVRLVKELSTRTLDLIVSFGERISSHIVAAIVDGAQRFDSLEFVKTKLSFGKHILDNEATQPLIHKTFDDFSDRVAIVPGFISTDSERGEITNLGRGGSDYTAAIIAAALDAEILEIWTDVDGFMTADPRVVDSPMVIDRMTFVEAMELCNFGAKVIYPPTIYPVFHKNIPIVIKNTFNPSVQGTLVTDTNPDETSVENPVKGISSINDTCVITVSGLGMVGEPGFNSRIFNALAGKGVTIFMVSQGSSENAVSFAVKNDAADTAMRTLSHEFADELESGKLSSIEMLPKLATVAIVGKNMKSDTILAGKLLNVLNREGFRILAFAHGTSDTNISFVIDLQNLKPALNLVHSTIFSRDKGSGAVTVNVAGEVADEFKLLLAERKDELGNCDVNIDCESEITEDPSAFGGAPVISVVKKLIVSGVKIKSLRAYFNADSLKEAKRLAALLHAETSYNMEEGSCYHLVIENGTANIAKATEIDCGGAQSLFEIDADHNIILKGFASTNSEKAQAIFNDLLYSVNQK